MKQITTSKGSYIFVEVKKGAKYIELWTGENCNDSLLFYRIKAYGKSYELILKGCANYTFICTTDTITEEIAKGIVEESRFHIGKFLNYNRKMVEVFHFNYATESFKSLLLSHNLSPDKTYAICKQN